MRAGELAPRPPTRVTRDTSPNILTLCPHSFFFDWLIVHLLKTLLSLIPYTVSIYSACMQAEQIEALYAEAVEASSYITRGNVELRKTIEVNRSSQKYVIVLLLVAAGLLLFFDWFSS